VHRRVLGECNRLRQPAERNPSLANPRLPLAPGAAALVSGSTLLLWCHEKVFGLDRIAPARDRALRFVSQLVRRLPGILARYATHGNSVDRRDSHLAPGFCRARRSAD